MTEFLKSFSSMSLALALLPVRQMQAMLRPAQTGHSDENGVSTMDAITTTAIRNFGGSLLRTFCTLDDAQRRAITTGARILSPFQDRGNRRSSDWSWPTSGTEEHRADFGLRL
jgi:hypothetical protein